MDRRFTPYQRKPTKKSPAKSKAKSVVGVHGSEFWTPEEDEILRRSVFKHGGKKWKTIATFFHRKTPNQCNRRWNELQNHGTAVKKPWSPREDLRMIELVHTHGPTKWAVIASYLPGRNGKQCRERWHNQLNPSIKKGPWTPEEDQIIEEMQAKYGNRWAKITEKLPGRTDNAVKNHWHSSMKAKIKRSNSSNAKASLGQQSVDSEVDLEVATPPILHSPIQTEVKQEPGSLSPNSVAMCPQSWMDMHTGNSVFVRDGYFPEDIDGEYFALPQAFIDEVATIVAADEDAVDAVDESQKDEDVDELLADISQEELVLSTDGESHTATLNDELFGMESEDDDDFYTTDAYRTDASDSDGEEENSFSLVSDVEPSRCDDGDSPLLLSEANDVSMDMDLMEVLSDLPIDTPEWSDDDDSSTTSETGEVDFMGLGAIGQVSSADSSDETFGAFLTSCSAPISSTPCVYGSSIGLATATYCVPPTYSPAHLMAPSMPMRGPVFASYGTPSSSPSPTLTVDDRLFVCDLM